MGSCSSIKKNSAIQNKPQVDKKPQQITTTQSPDFVFHRSGKSIFDRYPTPTAPPEIKPYDPYYKGYQYNVLIDGVIFQIVSPPEYLESNSPSISNENENKEDL